MNTVPAGRGSRISVPLPASRRIGGPFGGTCATLAAASALPGEGAVVDAAVVATGAAGGDRSSAPSPAAIPIKTDPAVARTSNLCITNLLTQVATQQNRSPFHLRARS